MVKEKTFVRITNRDIYNEIKSLHVKHDCIATKVKFNSRIINGFLVVFTGGLVTFFGLAGTKIFEIFSKVMGK